MRFKYTVDRDMQDLIAEFVPGFHKDWVIGIISDEQLLQVEKLRLYLVCAVNVEGSKPRYSNPMAVAAYNDTEAVHIYYTETDKPGSLMGVLNDHADRIKVEPIED